jgi:hypothetical protein
MEEAQSSVVGGGIMLQAGKLQILIANEVNGFSINLILPATLWPWGQLSLLPEMSTKNLPGG